MLSKKQRRIKIAETNEKIRKSLIHKHKKPMNRTKKTKFEREALELETAALDVYNDYRDTKQNEAFIRQVL